MRIAYFDCFAGCSGNMVLGALIDAGCPVEELTGYLRTLGLAGWELKAEPVRRNGFGATFVDVVQPPAVAGRATPPAQPPEPHAPVIADTRHGHDHSHGHHEHGSAGASRRDDADPTAAYLVQQPGQPHRHLPEILELIGSSGIPAPAKALASQIFTRLGEAEARVHRTTLEHVHFHEVGAVDAIVDITGAAIALGLLGIEEAVVSPVNVGGGTVRAAHGIIPVPGPATAELLAGAPIYHAGPAVELATPTGAAILTTIAKSFGPLPAMTLRSIGYGAGSRQMELPNLLRVLIGEREDRAGGLDVDSVVLIEANVDDLSPQGWELVFERLFAGGAHDVTLAPLTMKKQRPATMISVVAPPDRAEDLAAIVLRETTTIGVRLHQAQRRCLPRRVTSVETPYGPIRLKVATFGDVTRAMPEYDDCKRAAQQSGAPLREVQQAAEHAWRSRGGKGT